MDQNGPFWSTWPKEVHFGPFRSANRTLATPDETIRENQAIRASLRIDSRESGHLSRKQPPKALSEQLLRISRLRTSLENQAYAVAREVSRKRAEYCFESTVSEERTH